ncbi:hypothetical protein PEC18_34510 [Paucibacter sp. O1-1]|nr:hypothetical protein [Paucibacter sp. O1-1]MDA3830801.1 hypothetical protein [Paucibacter sp. O1-1]
MTTIADAYFICPTKFNHFMKIMLKPAAPLNPHINPLPSMSSVIPLVDYIIILTSSINTTMLLADVKTTF